MGKKKKPKGTASNPGLKKSAAQMMSNMAAEATTKQLHAYIDQQVYNSIAQLNQGFVTRFKNHGHRMLAIERLLNLTEEQVSLEISNIEDEVTGHFTVDRPCKTEDLVRLALRHKAKEDADFKAWDKVLVTNLNMAPFSLGVEIESKLIGASVGDIVSIGFKGDFQKAEFVENLEEADHVYEIKVEKVSEPKQPKHKPEEEEPSNEIKDAE